MNGIEATPIPPVSNSIGTPIDAIVPLQPPELHVYGVGELLNGYIGVFIVGFIVTLVATPFVRKLAIEMDIIDRPNDSRKEHKYPIA